MAKEIKDGSKAELDSLADQLKSGVEVFTGKLVEYSHRNELSMDAAAQAGKDIVASVDKALDLVTVKRPRKAKTGTESQS